MDITRGLPPSDRICIVGLGYVGLPLAIAFAKTFEVVGFDISTQRIEELEKGIDCNNEENLEELRGKIYFSSSLRGIPSCDTFIITVPTPVDHFNEPDLTALISATSDVGKVICKGDLVVFESTVFPGCSVEVCIPLLEKYSGLTVGSDFDVAYSPERVNPGDPHHKLLTTSKIVSGFNDQAAQRVAALYSQIGLEDIFVASSIEVAEAAKLLENMQRDVNIALLNEFSLLMNRLSLSTCEVLRAAGTKWNFVKFTPGMVGGHCVSVDPYYFTYRAQQVGVACELVNAARVVNENMPKAQAERFIQEMVNITNRKSEFEILVLGISFKPNVSDVRNSKIFEFIGTLCDSAAVSVFDPLVSKSRIESVGLDKRANILESIPNNNIKYDGIALAVPHDELLLLNSSFFETHLKSQKYSIVFDFHGAHEQLVSPDFNVISL